MLKIVIHDYAGHPFQFDLSKKLSQTFKIYHFYFKNDYGPKANFSNLNFDNLNVEGLGENIIYKKSNFVDRFFKDIKYGKIVSNKINEIKPDIIISGNCPTLSQNIIINSAKRNNSKFIFWIQDFYSEAVEILLKKKLSILAIPIYSLFKFLEKKQLKFSDKLIIISDDFKNKLSKWKINLDNVHYIPNWGNLETIEFFNKKNTKFLIENNLDPEKFYIMYSGTLALKHNPDLIVNRGDLRELCAGSVAMIFEKMGGEVIYFGKPYPEVYNQSIDNKNKKILSIGDNLNTDIKGANLLNFDSLIISNGIHKNEIKQYGIEKISKSYEAICNYIQSELKW